MIQLYLNTYRQILFHDIFPLPGQCVEPLGLSLDLEGNYKIPDSAMTQTSQLSPGAGWHAAGRNARLYMEDDYNDLRIGKGTCLLRLDV